MKRFHVHVAVDKLDESIEFYSKLFGAEPAKLQKDYAKWMLEDPRINFAISSRVHSKGADHFGFQVDSAEELSQIRSLAESASNGQVINQGEASCCYAKSEKHWTIDPTGIAWEHFHTLSDSQEFGVDTATSQDSACCVPLHAAKKVDTAACCIFGDPSNNAGSCCG